MDGAVGPERFGAAIAGGTGAMDCLEGTAGMAGMEGMDGLVVILCPILSHWMARTKSVPTPASSHCAPISAWVQCAVIHQVSIDQRCATLQGVV